jgi:hypothetical protein
MTKFSEWLENKENKPNIAYGGFFKDGRVIVYVDGKRYEYITDAVYHERWKRRILREPFKVLNEIKKLAIKQPGEED